MALLNLFGTAGKDTMTVDGSTFSLNNYGTSTISSSNVNLYAGKGNDTIIVRNNPTGTIGAHGERGNDIILVSALNNGLPGQLTPYLIPSGPGVATSTYLSGGIGSHIMAAMHPTSITGHQKNVFLGDTRLFSNATDGVLATENGGSKGH